MTEDIPMYRFTRRDTYVHDDPVTGRPVVAYSNGAVYIGGDKVDIEDIQERAQWYAPMLCKLRGHRYHLADGVFQTEWPREICLVCGTLGRRHVTFI